MNVLIIGGGIGGLTLALSLHQVGISCRIFEAADEIRPLGVGINLLPHAMREFTDLGLAEAIAARGVKTREVSFYNRFGQHIYTEPRGHFAGYDWPQVSIHRGVLQEVLLSAVRDRLGSDAMVTGHIFGYAEISSAKVTAHFSQNAKRQRPEPVTGDVLVGCDGIRSTLRAQLHPKDGPFVYSGITMWRGVTRWKPYLTGATMVYAGWLETGKVIVYPLEDMIDDDGCQLVNWLCEFYTPPRDPSGDWTQPGEIGDFLWACQEMHFDWLDIPALVRAADFILEYPMVDKVPLDRWSFGLTTLLGDAAHPMYPRGSNGAGQAVLDARTLADHLASAVDPAAALAGYEADRREATEAIVLANRTIPPDAILREIYERTGDKPFASIEAVISREEILSISEKYKQVAGFQREILRERSSIVASNHYKKS